MLKTECNSCNRLEFSNPDALGFPMNGHSHMDCVSNIILLLLREAITEGIEHAQQTGNENSLFRVKKHFTTHSITIHAMCRFLNEQALSNDCSITVFTELTCVISSVHSTDIIQPIMFLLA
jgi:hypothetical protein